jgi:hypothetical protein
MVEGDLLSAMLTRSSAAVLALTLLAVACSSEGSSSDQDPGAGHLVFDPATVHAFGNVTVGQTVTASLAVWNRTAQDCTLGEMGHVKAPYSFAGGAFPGTGSDCGGVLAAGARCNVVVAFAPASAGDFVTYSSTFGGTTAQVDYAVAVKCLGHAGTGADPTPLATCALSGTGL